MPTHRTTILAAGVAVLALLPVAATSLSNPAEASASTGQHTRALGDCEHRVVEPRRVLSACGDAGEYLIARHYAFWHDDAARGHGRFVVNDCRPNCAAGHYHHYAARFRFHRVVATQAGPMFSRVRVFYERHGHMEATVLDLPTRPV